MAAHPLVALDGAPDEQLAWIESELERAAESGLLRPLPSDAAHFTTEEMEPGQISALRDRLYRLGYLNTSRGPNTVTKRLRNVVARFQSEAGLPVDGWVGTLTWQALQELFAFEPPSHLDRWFTHGEMTPALRRAVHLRMSVLGVVPWNPKSGPAALEDALRRWAQILSRLSVDSPQPAPAPGVRSLIAWMFDLDRLVAHLAANRNAVRRAMESGPRVEKMRVRKLVNCLVQIELWLLGDEDVKPAGMAEPISRRKRGHKKQQGGFSYSKLYRAQRRFWKDQGLSSAHLPQTHRMLLRTIAGLDALREDDLPEAKQRRACATELIEHLETTQGIDLDRRWREVSVSSRVWDGARRLFRFVTRLFRRAIDWVKEKITLVVRMAYQAAAEAFAIVGRATRSLTDAVENILSPEVGGSNEHIAMHRDKDFDFRVFVHDRASHEEVVVFLNLLRARLLRFHVTIRILKLLLGAALLAAKSMAGPVGWWSIIRTLIALYGDLRQDDIVEMRQPILV